MEEPFNLETSDGVYEMLCQIELGYTPSTHEIRLMRDISNLTLTGPSITRLPKSIYFLSSLQILNLGMTQIESIPEDIGKLRSLRKLNLFRTKIKALPPSICKLQQLQSLDVSCTEIEHLPSNICDLRLLQTLDLRQTKIMELPTNIGMLSSLRKINLSRTLLKELPNSMINLPAGCEINISKTSVQYVPLELQQKCTIKGLPKTLLANANSGKDKKANNHMETITWLHLSDLHIGRDPYNQDAVLEKLLEDIEKTTIRESIRLDMVLISGDLVFSGKEEQYDLAYSFLKNLMAKTGLAPNDIIIAPGNHDVDWALTLPKTKKAIKTIDNRDKVTQILSDEKALEDYRSGLRNYYTFLANRFPWAQTSNKSSLHFTVNKSINGTQIAVMALNTAWLAYGGRNEKGLLVLGEKQVRDAFEECCDSKLTISLMHHPFSWLQDFDTNDVQGILERRADFILSGHEHRARLIGQGALLGKAFKLSAGAVYEGRSNQLNSYNIVKCDVNRGIAECYFREYIDRDGGFWTNDNTLGETITNGKIVVKYRASLEDTNALKGDVDKKDIVSGTTLSKPTRKRPEMAPSFWVNPDETAVPFPVHAPPKDLIQKIIDGKCILFAGAGASMDAGLPGWSDMLAGMINRVDECFALPSSQTSELKRLLQNGEYEIVAEFCKDKLGKRDFADYIKTSLRKTTKPSLTHSVLAQIPFNAAITTNYDNLLETNHNHAKVVLPHDLCEKPKKYFRELFHDDFFPVIKIHGSVEDEDSFILTDADYRRIIFRQEHYRENLKEIIEDKTILFVGFSFRDPSINLLLQEIFTMSGGATCPNYALMPEVGPIKTDFYRQSRNVRIISYPIISGSHIALSEILNKIASECSKRG